MASSSSPEPSNSQPNIASAEADLYRWCTSLRPDMLDIFSDFGAKNVFLIDFDALLCEIMSDKSLYWVKGGQTLHLVYLFESALNQLLERGGVFELVVFKESSRLIWNKMPINRRFAREAVLFHVRAFLSEKAPLREFASWWCEDYKHYLKHLQPSFILLSTGYEMFTAKAESKNGFDDPFGAKLALYFVSEVLFMLSQKQSVAFAESLWPTSHRVDAFCLTPLIAKLSKNLHEGSTQSELMARDLLPSLLSYFSSQVELLPEPLHLTEIDASTVVDVYNTMKAEVSDTYVPWSLAFSVVMFAAAVRNLQDLKCALQPAVLADTIRLFMLQNVLLATLPVDRRILINKYPRAQTCAITKPWAQLLGSIVFPVGADLFSELVDGIDFVSDEVHENSATAWTLADVFDGRFCVGLAYRVPTREQMPKNLLALMDVAWNSLCARANMAAVLSKSKKWFDEANVACTGQEVAGDLASVWGVDLAHATLPLVALDNRFLNDYFNEYQVKRLREGNEIEQAAPVEVKEEEETEEPREPEPEEDIVQLHIPQDKSVTVEVKEYAEDDQEEKPTEAVAEEAEEEEEDSWDTGDWDSKIADLQVKSGNVGATEAQVAAESAKKEQADKARRQEIAAIEAHLDPCNTTPVFIDTKNSFLPQNIEFKNVKVDVEIMADVMEDIAEIQGDEEEGVEEGLEPRQAGGLTNLSADRTQYTDGQITKLKRLTLQEIGVDVDGTVGGAHARRGLTDVDPAIDSIDTDAHIRLEKDCTGQHDPEIFTFGVDKELDDKTKREVKSQYVRKRRGWVVVSGAQLEREKKLKEKQKFIRFFQEYAQSMTGFQVMRSRVVISGSFKATKAVPAIEAAPDAQETKTKDKKEKGGKGKPGAGGGKKKATGVSMREQIQLETLKKAEDKKKEEEMNKLKQFMMWIEDERTLDAKIEKLQTVYLVTLQITEVLLQGHFNLLRLAMDAVKTSATPLNIARAFRIIHDMYNRFRTNFEKGQLQEVYDALVKLGFPRSAALMNHDAPTELQLPKAPHYKEVRTGKPYKDLTETRFQMRYMGEFMERDTQSSRDPRVEFMPDEWQVKMLDVVDNNESALVVAPTSAGKTFVSFYVMSKILAVEDDSMAVYVCPAKALINQVVSEVYAKFGHIKYASLDKNVFGMLGPDYRYEPLNCKILVTVPEALETLLLSPEHGPLVLKKMKYVIFDEVHCASDFLGGEIWKHLLCMITCPFMALSATIGNPENFYNWLKLTQDNFNRNIQLIVHKQRYSELRKWIYFPNKINKTLTTLKDETVTEPVSPQAAPVQAQPAKAPVAPKEEDDGIAFGDEEDFEEEKPVTKTKSKSKPKKDLEDLVDFGVEEEEEEKPKASKSKPKSGEDEEKPKAKKSPKIEEPGKVDKKDKDKHRKDRKISAIGEEEEEDEEDAAARQAAEDFEKKKEERRLRKEAAKKKTEKTEVELALERHLQELAEDNERRERERKVTSEFPPFIQVDDYQKLGTLQDLHPCATLQLADLKNGFPADLAFEPKDSLELFDAMKAVWKDHPNITKVDPDWSFRTTRCITQRGARDYADKVKRMLESWLKAKELDKVKAVLERLGGDKIANLYKESEAVFPDADVANVEDFLSTHFLELLMYLYNDDKLPAIAFCFDKTRCENLVIQTAKQLEDMEMIYNRNTQAEYRAMDKERAKKEKEVKRLRDKKEKKKEEDAKKEGTIKEEDELRPESDYDPRFTFALEGVGMGKEERERKFKALGDLGYVKPDLVKALKRGIGAHHPDLPKKYRQLVEMLFRSGYLRVIVSTQSLALGINVPCRTTIFAGDSNFLNPLYYRQMGGRAGRRGYDVLGHTVFFHIPQIKVRRLLTSPVPVIQGHFALSPSYLLRLQQFIEMSAVEVKRSVRQIAANNLIQPNSGHAATYLPEQIKYHARYMLETMVRLGLMLPNAFPTRVSAFVTLISDEAPGNMLFFYLVQQGIIHRVCKPWKEALTKTRAELDLLQVLAFCFRRRQLPFMARFGEAQAVLPPLPDFVADAVDRYNKKVMSVSSHYLASYMTEHKADLPATSALPVSDLETAAADVTFTGPLQCLSEETGAVQGMSQPLAVTRNPCSMTSGHGWLFSDVRDLNENHVKGVTMDRSALPIVPMADRQGRPITLSSYIVDFYAGDGKLESICETHGIGRADLWRVLHDFVLVMKRVSYLVNAMFGEAGETVQCMKAVYKNYDEWVERFW